MASSRSAGTGNLANLTLRDHPMGEFGGYLDVKYGRAIFLEAVLAVNSN